MRSEKLSFENISLILDFQHVSRSVEYPHPNQQEFHFSFWFEGIVDYGSGVGILFVF